MDFSYIIVFVILIIGVLIWQLSQSRSRQFTLSKQIFPDLDLLVIIAKKERKIQDVIVRVEAKKELNLLHIRCELISENREFTYIDSRIKRGFCRQNIFHEYLSYGCCT